MSAQNNNKKMVDVAVTYLEQTSRPVLQAPIPPKQKVAILRAESPAVHFYRYLYQQVGQSYNWISRRQVSDRELSKIIQNPSVYIYILYLNGCPAGFAEIDARQATSHEIKFFGLMPEHTGMGLGRYFLTHIIEIAWTLSPKRLQLETSSLDHPAALPLYQKFGFQVFNRRNCNVELHQP